MEVGSYQVDTSSDAQVVTAPLTPGANYYAEASGTFKVGYSKKHIADAEYHRKPGETQWRDLTTLPMGTDMGLDDASGRLGHWGDHTADSVYGQSFTPTTHDPLQLFYQDVEGEGPNGPGSTWYYDNAGSLTVKLYQEVQVTVRASNEVNIAPAFLSTYTNTQNVFTVEVSPTVAAQQVFLVIADTNTAMFSDGEGYLELNQAIEDVVLQGVPGVPGITAINSGLEGATPATPVIGQQSAPAEAPPAEPMDLYELTEVSTGLISP